METKKTFNLIRISVRQHTKHRDTNFTVPVRRSYLCFFSNASLVVTLSDYACFACLCHECEHSQNSNVELLKEILSCTAPLSFCIQNEFIVDSPRCCSEHTLATNKENDSIFMILFFSPDDTSSPTHNKK